MSDCGCTKVGCECMLQAGSFITITGIGTVASPYVISCSVPQVNVADTPSLDMAKDAAGIVTGRVRLAPLLQVADTTWLNMTLAGAGTEASPFVLSATLTNVDLAGGVTGNVLTKLAGGGWGPGPATQAPVGAVSTADGIGGDGSAGDPIVWTVRTYAELEALGSGGAEPPPPGGTLYPSETLYPAENLYPSA